MQRGLLLGIAARLQVPPHFAMLLIQLLLLLLLLLLQPDASPLQPSKAVQQGHLLVHRHQKMAAQLKWVIM